MPGYPKVDQQSDYLIARYDGAVLDAKPWGRGALEGAPTAQALGYSGQQTVVLHKLLRKEVLMLVIFQERRLPVLMCQHFLPLSCSQSADQPPERHILPRHHAAANAWY